MPKKQEMVQYSIVINCFQEEVEKRKKRAAKFGTPLVEDGLKPAITSREQTRASTQQAAPVQEEVVPADVELSEAGKPRLIRE